MGDDILRQQTIQDGFHRGDTLDQPNAMLVDEVLTYTTREGEVEGQDEYLVEVGVGNRESIVFEERRILCEFAYSEPL